VSFLVERPILAVLDHRYANILIGVSGYSQISMLT
jgi:hypothetical protein